MKHGAQEVGWGWEGEDRKVGFRGRVEAGRTSLEALADGTTGEKEVTRVKLEDTLSTLLDIHTGEQSLAAGSQPTIMHHLLSSKSESRPGPRPLSSAVLPPFQLAYCPLGSWDWSIQAVSQEVDRCGQLAPVELPPTDYAQLDPGPTDPSGVTDSPLQLV